MPGNLTLCGRKQQSCPLERGREQCHNTFNQTHDSIFLEELWGRQFQIGHAATKANQHKHRQPRASVCARVCLDMCKPLCFRIAIQKSSLWERKEEVLSESSFLLSRKLPFMLLKTKDYPETAFRGFQKGQGILTDSFPWHSVEFLLKFAVLFVQCWNRQCECENSIEMCQIWCNVSCRWMLCNSLRFCSSCTCGSFKLCRLTYFVVITIE